MSNCLKIVLDISFFDVTEEGGYSLSPETSVINCNGCFADIIDYRKELFMQIYLSLMSQKNPSSDSSSYDLSSPQGRMLYVRETTNAAFSSWTSPLQRQDPDTQEEKKQEMLSRIMGKLKSGKKLSAKELDFLRRTDPILYAHALRVQRMAEALKQQLSHAKSKQEANDMITSAIAGVSDKDPDKEYLLAAYNEVSKNFHKSPAYQRLPNTPEDAKKRKTNNPNAHFSDDEDTNDDTDDLLSWTPLQEIIDAAPTLECQG